MFALRYSLFEHSLAADALGESKISEKDHPFAAAAPPQFRLKLCVYIERPIGVVDSLEPSIIAQLCFFFHACPHSALTTKSDSEKLL